MKVSELNKHVTLTLLSGKKGLENEITGAYVSDLLSDVMGNADNGNIWVTLQVHRNIIGVASLRDLAAIIIVKNLQPDKDTLELSEKEGIPVYTTPLGAFELCSKLYNLFIKNEIIQG